MILANLTLFITTHAFNQYCERVEQVEAAALWHEYRSKFAQKEFNTKQNFIQIGGVWWVYVVNDEKQEILLVTCYGRTSMDLPAALKWSRVHRDGIDLHNMIVVGDDT